MSQVSAFFENTDELVQQEFLRNLKVRSIEQKFLYFGEGSSLYYDVPTAYPLTMWISPEELVAEISEVINKDEKVGFISLGCGSAMQDRDVMQLLYKNGHRHLHLIGVDSSESMIQRAQKELENEEFSYELWIEDINTHKFYQRIRDVVATFDKVVFTFFGRTMGNMVQTEVIDTLYNLTSKGNLVWFDCQIRESNKKIGDLELFNRFAKKLHETHEFDAMFYPLDILGVPKDAGTMMLENISEESVGVLNFRYSFRFTKPCTVKCINEYIHFIPPEKIKLLDIRTYHPDTMISYFEQHDFSLHYKTYKGNRGQFLFERR